jgi:preprotein translocase SecE subunit
MNPMQFLRESLSELKKSTWMTREQAVGSTVVVVVLVSMMAMYISSIDFVLSIIMGALLGRPA